MMLLQDAAQRLQATDPTGSYIVQAPAGSGKTELLTQRFLRLLSRVDAPEHIVALTFTRKAASEMRERVLKALQRAAAGYDAQSPHQQLTQQYASEALAQDKRLNWQLLTHPARLKILTIDALCQAISHAIPLQEKQVPYAQIAPDSYSYYRAAAMACLNEAVNNPDLQESISLLLLHLDNRQDKLIDLFCDLLATREQWLEAIFSARHHDKANFEAALKAIEEHELNQFKAAIPPQWYEKLRALSQQMASIESPPNSARFALTNWISCDTPLTREIATGLAHLLLTGKDELRQGFDRYVGLKKDACDNKQYTLLKNESKELLNHLRDYPDFHKHLVKIKTLPTPVYDKKQWQVLQAMLTLLPRLAAHLHLVFSENNCVDFTAISQQALLALGTDEQPTDLALYLDYAIHHLLIDEFQDTSIHQYQLLTRLVQGWQIDDGKTLFIVGDPMQSIYRFRQAEVGLFLKAKQQGIGNVKLIPLELSCNFRSTSTLVTWVNQQFNVIFPTKDDLETGAVSFHPSSHVLEAEAESFIKALQQNDKHHEAQEIIKCIQEELNNPANENIAILVRSRSQLKTLIPLLRVHNISFQGVEIEQLADLPHIQDHWSLTKALLMPGDRLSWLAILRSPWCGLTLADLHLISNYNKDKPLIYALSNLKDLEGISQEGLIRAQFIYQILQHALDTRHQQPLVSWLIHTSQRLFGKLILDNQQQQDLEQFWLLLEEYNQDGLLHRLNQFEDKLSQLYSQRANPSRLQIMTIHKSKGLEFDTVILPTLSHKTRDLNKPLLRWLKLPSYYGDNLLLMSPVRANDEQQCLLYDYLGDLNNEKDYFEQQRLLYVAVTRAKKRLYLFDYTDKQPTGSFRAFLSKTEFVVQEKIEQEENTCPVPPLLRVPLQYYQQGQPITKAPLISHQLINRLSSARFLGVVSHELLQWICDKHPQHINDLPWPYIDNQLKKYGLYGMEFDEAINRLRDNIENLLNSPIGKWICQPHENEQNEYAYLIEENNEMHTRIIDRTFCENGKRWIIDFKTGLDDALTQDEHRYQVNAYAKHFSTKESRPIFCGIYYLATNHWLHWPFLQEELVLL